jgi:putative ABC transport system substrate-binding protein
MNKRRKLIVALGAGVLVVPFRAFAQQQGKVWRLGYLRFGSRQSDVDSGLYAALIEGLRERGYVEGKNLAIDARYAEGNTNRLNEFAAELVRQKVDVILTAGSETSLAVRRATTTIPVVVTVTTDPVQDGYAASLARPGSNFTGMANGQVDTVQKLVELLIVAAPKLKRIAVLTTPTSYSGPAMLLQVQAAAGQMGKQAVPIHARTPEEIERGFATMVRERVDAVIILANAFMFAQRAQIAALALKHRLPSIYTQQQYPEAGGLMSYGADTNDNYRRAGIFVDKILKGTKPGDIPFEQPTRYYLVVNRKTANALGIKPTNELWARADKIIE